RLIAIRTLGELKSADAGAALTPLLDSKEMFVADYARRALAAIEGKPAPPRPVVAHDKLESDLWMLPGNVMAVAQVAPHENRPGDIAKAIDAMVMPVPGIDKKQVVADMANLVIGLAEKIGNVRIDGVTVACSDDLTESNGYVIT